MPKKSKKSSHKRKAKPASLPLCKDWSAQGNGRCKICWKEYWGARRSERKNEDGRTPSQRDYARVVHSSAFRRLQAKTQVFGLGDSDFYRTRLTHSMEVSQIGEGITRELRHNKKVCSSVRRTLPDSSLIRAICLAHDLGHPPFGHGGERALNKMMVKFGGFEGNGQSLRIMSQLESYDKNHGMDLSRRTLLGVLKYPAPYKDVVNQRSYPKENEVKRSGKDFTPPKCYLDSEVCIIDWIKEGLESDWTKVSTDYEKEKGKHKRTKHMSLDASILEAADDIAYRIHDLEDVIAMKLISKKNFTNFVDDKTLKPLFEFKGSTISSYKNFVKYLFHKDSSKRKQAIGNLVGFFIRNIELDQENNHKFSNPIFSTRVKFNEDHLKILNALKKLVREKVIYSAQVQRLEFKGQQVIEDLFRAFQSNPEKLLPPEKAKLYRKAESIDSEDSEKMCMRVICDYVSGMSDYYAIHRYRQMFEPSVGSLFDYLGR